MRGKMLPAGKSKDRAAVQRFELLLGWSSNQEKGAWINWRLIWSMTTKERVSLAAGHCGSSNWNFESGNSQGYRQERVILAAKKLEQKDPPRANSEENSSCTQKLDASSPEMENNNQISIWPPYCNAYKRNWDGLQLMLLSQSVRGVVDQRARLLIRGSAQVV